MEPTRAPWAAGAADGDPAAPTRAPWAGGAEPPTRAPWASEGGAAGLPPGMAPADSGAARPGTPFITAPGRARGAGAAAAPEPEPGPGGFRTPVKAICSPTDLPKWVESETYAAVVRFAKDLQAAARGRTVREALAMSAVCEGAVSMLETMGGWVEEIPPQQQPMRFGNKAFKDWHARLLAELPALLGTVLGPSPASAQDAAPELAPYLGAAFGDPQRIDYGTGHEASFAAWMLAMLRVGAFTPEDMAALALRVFPAYLRLMRKASTIPLASGLHSPQDASDIVVNRRRAARLQAGAGRLARRVGPGRLPVSALPPRRSAAVGARQHAGVRHGQAATGGAV